MRALKGHVDLLGLANVVQLISMNKCEGVLAVTKGREKQAIHFGPNGIRMVSSTVPRVRRLSKLARKVLGPKPITPERLKTILRKEKLLGWTLGQIALSNAPVKKEDVEQALRQQVQEEVLDLFVWTQATFEFREGKLPRQKAGERLSGLALSGDVTSLLLEAARRADEVLRMREALTDDNMRIIKVPREIHADDLGEDVVRVDAILPLINRPRRLKAILQSSIYPRFATMRAIHRLLHLGYAKAHDREGNTAVRTQPAPGPSQPQPV